MLHCTLLVFGKSSLNFLKKFLEEAKDSIDLSVRFFSKVVSDLAQ